MKNKLRRPLAFLLSAAMIFTMWRSPVYAVADSGQPETGLCEHHPEHTADCGYNEGTPGTPCTHEHKVNGGEADREDGLGHTEDCYTLVTECVHAHTEACYPAPNGDSVSGNAATPSEAEEAEPTECTHECSEDTGCITKELDCRHEHDEDCGYIEETSGTPCTYVCEICNSQSNDENGQKPETESGAQEHCSCMILCTEDHKNPDCPVCGAEGADFADCKGKAPDSIEPECICTSICTEDAMNVDCPVCKAEGAKPENCKGKPAAKTENPAVAAVIALIDALPTVDEIYNGMVGDGEEGYDEWLAGMQTILADIQRAKVEYDALSVEDRALIDQTHTDKLQELVGLTDRLKEAAPMTDKEPTITSTEIFANGIPIKIVAGTTEGRTNILWDIDGDGSIGDDEYLKIGSDAPSAAGYDLSDYNIYGGGNGGGTVTGSTSIIIAGGTMRDVYGGGRNSIVTSTNISVTGGTVRDVFGGGSLNDTVTSTNVTISGGTVRDVYGGGGSGTVTSTNVTISGSAQVTGNVYGGGYAGTVTGSTNVNVSGGAIKNVYGGGITNSTVTDSTSVTISGNIQVTDNVYDNGNGGTVEGSTSINVSDGATVTVDGSLISSGTLIVDGTLTGTGTLLIDSSDARVISGKGTIDDALGILVFLTDDMIADIEPVVYTGSAFTPEPEVSIQVLNRTITYQKGDDADDDADFYYSYSDNTNAGTATVTVVPNFSTLIGDPLAKKFTIQKSGSALGLTADKLDKTYTYGDSITFTVMPKVQQSVYRSRTAAENTVDFYCGETKLNDTPITAVEGKAVTFVYDTGKKGIPTGTHTITAVYGGSGNLNGVTESVEVTINPKTLTAAVNSADSKATKVYDKNNRFTDVTLTLNGLVNADDAVTAVADGTATDANVGSGKAFTVTSVTLSGVDQDYYTLAIGDVSGTVTIIAGESRLALTADKTTATYGDTITFTVTPALKTTLQSRTAAENTVDFYCGETKLNDTPITAVEGKAAAFTYDTNQKGIPAGTQSIKAVYSGGGNLNGVTESVEVTINPKALTAAVKSGDASAAKVYDGSADFSGVKLTLDGVIGSDAVSATASGTADNANAGDGKAFNVTAVALNGADNGWYSLAESAVSGTVKITKASGGLNISCSDVTYGGTVSPTVTANLGGGAVAYSYKGRNGTSYGPSDTAPTDAGQYTVVATAEATENYESATATADFEIKKAAGRLTISCADVTYGGTVSPTVTANLGGGAVTYSYAGRNGTSYGPSDTAPTDAGQYTVTGTAAATTNYEQATSAAVDFTINKAAGAAISSVTGSYTGDGSTFTYIIDPTTGAEYSTDNTNWQDGNTFTGFKVGDTATFYARMKADQNHTAGPSGNTGAVTFTRLAKTENPSLQYTVSGATGSKKITIAKVAGCEYTFDNGASWDGENEQTFATDGRPVIGIRYAQTATHEASAGAMQEVDLKNQEQAAPKAFTLKFMDNGDGTFTAAIPTVTGGEYSFDGVNWSDSNTKTDCLPNTAYTGYVRLAAKDGYNASPVTSDTRTAPSLIVADPVIKPNGGDFSGSLNVTITTDTPGAAIYYTIDGTAPTVASTAYTDPFTLTASATVQAIAVKDGYEDSQITSAVFTKRTGGSSGGGGGSSSGSSGGTSQPDTGKPDKPDAPVTGETTPVKPDTNGNVSVDNSSVQSAINKAKEDAKKNGTTENGIAVTVPVTPAAGQTSFHVTIQAETLDLLVKEKVWQFNVVTDHLVSVNIGLDTLKQLDTVSAGGDIILRADKVDTLHSTEAKAAIGTRPSYDLSLVYLSGGKETPITHLNGHTISVRLPYTPTKGEAAGNLYAVYVDDAGKVEWIIKSSYDDSQKAVVFETGHFSVYGIGYKNPVQAFTDITGHWAADNILFVASRGLLSGTSDTTFSPNTGMTREMFVTALGRLAGINPDSYKTGKFTDVKANAYYAPYVNWAAQTGIVEGITATTFAPDININREQMAVIMAKYSKQLGYDLPQTRKAATFADNAQISSWAKNAVKSMQQAGILAGKANNRFDPAGTATRAEVATLLRRFVEIVIDPQAANGWQQNDSGQWSYYRNGEPVKGWLSDDQKWYWLDKTIGMMFTGGWKQIDGKWYYFYTDGAMAVNTTIDGYTIGSDGARK